MTEPPGPTAGRLKRRSRAAVAVLLLIVSGVSFVRATGEVGGAPEHLWQHAFGGPAQAVGGDVAMAGDEAVYVAHTVTTQHKGGAAAVALLSPSGDVVWRRVAVGVGASPHIYGYPDGGLLLVTTEARHVSGKADRLVVHIQRWTSAGAVVWAREVASAESERAKDLVVDASGEGYLVTTVAQSTDLARPGHVDVRRMSPDGVVVWQRHFRPGSGGATAAGVARGASRDLYVTGTVYPSGFDGGASGAARVRKIFVARFDLQGTVRWTRRWVGAAVGWPEGRGASAADAAADGSGVVIGGSVGIDRDADPWTAPVDAVLLAYDRAGNLKWQRTFGGTHYDRVNDVALHGSRIGFVGDSSGNTRLTAGALVGEASRDGQLRWVTIIGRGSVRGDAVAANSKRMLIAVTRVAFDDSDPRGSVIHAYRLR